MIITRKHAKRLEARGEIYITGITRDGEHLYVSATDTARQRTLHYPATTEDVARVNKQECK